MLLDAAGKILRKRGTTLSFEAMAEAADVSATLPYKYFDSVDDVALELYQRFVRAIDDATDQLLADPDADFDTKVRGGMDLWFDAIRRDGSLLLRLTGSDAPSGLQRSVEQRRRRVTKLWAHEVAEEFGLEPEDAGLAAAALIAATSAVLQRCRVERLDRHEVTEKYVRMVRAMCEAAGPTD